MSQVLAGCCCTTTTGICTQTCDDRSVTPNTITLNLPSFQWLLFGSCLFPWCYPGGQPGDVGFTSPARSLPMHLCARVANPNTSNTSRSWLYRSTAIPIGTVQSAIGFYAGPCSSKQLFLVAALYQICGLASGIGPPSYTTQWTLTINVVRGKDYGTGFCLLSNECQITPIDMATSPCSNYNSATAGTPFASDFFTWTSSGSCPPVTQSPETVRTPDGTGGFRFDTELSPTDNQGRWTVYAVQSRWALDPSAPPQCDPRGDYLYADLLDGVGTISVT